MKSTIKIDFAGVEDSANQFRPVIKVSLIESEDTRDKLLKSFFEALGYESSWLTVQRSPYSDSSHPKNFIISPIEDSELAETIKIIRERLNIKADAIRPLSELLLEIEERIDKPLISPQFGDKWKEHGKEQKYEYDTILDIAWRQGRKAILLERLLEQVYPK